MKQPDELDLLRRAAERARARPDFLAWILAQYERMEGMPEKTLRAHLGVTEEDWPRLQLCLRPRVDAFLQDVTQIASEFNIDRASLASVVRRVEAVEVAQKREEPGSVGSLLAARTRKRPKWPPKPEVPDDE